MAITKKNYKAGEIVTANAMNEIIDTILSGGSGLIEFPKIGNDNDVIGNIFADGDKRTIYGSGNKINVSKVTTPGLSENLSRSVILGYNNQLNNNFSTSISSGMPATVVAGTNNSITPQSVIFGSNNNLDWYGPYSMSENIVAQVVLGKNNKITAQAPYNFDIMFVGCNNEMNLSATGTSGYGVVTGIGNKIISGYNRAYPTVFGYQNNITFSGYSSGSSPLVFGSANNVNSVSNVIIFGSYCNAQTPNTAYSMNGQSMHAFGSYANVNANCGHAIGYYTRVEGNVANNAAGQYSSAIGPYAQVIESQYSTAIGYNARIPSVADKVFRLGADDLSELQCAVNLQVKSDQRDKADIKPIGDVMNFIDGLQTVEYVRNNRDYYAIPEPARPQMTGEMTVEQYSLLLQKYEQEYSDYQTQAKEFKKTSSFMPYDKTAHAAGAKKGSRKRLGLLAQPTMALLKQYFGENFNIVNDDSYDYRKEHPEITDYENRLRMDYVALVPILIKGAQEQSEVLKHLSQEITQLKGWK